MKTINKVLMALAASLLLMPVASAQEVLPGTDLGHEKYLMNDKGTIGYNKYLVSDTPNAAGEYTLRIENFVTGSIDNYAVPTDFVLVLDCSGSMLYDYRTISQDQMPAFVSKADNDVSHFIVKDDGYENFNKCAYHAIYQTGTYGGTGGGTKLWVNVFFDKPTSGSAIRSIDVSRYYFYEDTATPSNTGYYYIYHKTIDGIRNLYITLQDGTPKYLYGTTVHDAPNTDTAINGDTKIIYTGDIWRPLQRREKLIQAVEAFATQIKAENAKDQWKDDEVKHQIAIVSFGNGYNGNSIASAKVESATYNYNTKVIKAFSEVTDPTVYSTAMNQRMKFMGSTYVDLGVTLGRVLFEDLQAEDNMGPVTATGGTNRNKVMIVLTDGQPSGHNTASGWSGQRGVIKEALKEGVKVKTRRASDPLWPNAEVSSTGINGLIFTIDLYNIDKSKPFLNHLSSNYPKSDQSATTGNWDTAGYSGTIITPAERQIYYNDGSSTDLTEIFRKIGEASTGETKQMVAVDVMSDDFVIPFSTTDVGKVNIFTAQCIGMKRIDDVDYLAFAQEVQAPTRESLDHLWVPYVEGEGASAVTKWRDLGEDYAFDIDGTSTSPKIKFAVSDDGKKIILSGFDYPAMFCGLDPDSEHANNTRQIEADDPNFDYQLDGYRGFKMIFEFPIVLDPDALGGVNVPTNDVDASGLYISDSNGNPIGDPEVNYPTPDLPVPVRLVIQKKGLKPGESANFTVQRKLRTDASGTYTDFTTFVITGDANAIPEVRIINLDPAYYYKVKEGNWSWAYQNVSPEYSTDPGDPNAVASNPIVFTNTPEDDTPKHAEAKATNSMRKTGSETVSE